jgi:deoxyribose-phosphate aldolase
VYAAAMTAMMAGSDFVKTSTGKEPLVNANLLNSLVMITAIRDFKRLTGVKVRK